MYADYMYYIDKYLLGKHPEVPEEEYLFWEKKAREEVDRYTFDRISRLPMIPDKVKECVCAITELLYKSSQLSEQASSDGTIGVMTSYSNDGESASFDISQSVYTENGKKVEIKRLIHLYLDNTGLLYTGVN